jgi:chemotaxis methyl-accepting protein methylase
MIFQEQITATRSGATLQVFASDIDADAVARARLCCTELAGSIVGTGLLIAYAIRM